MTSISETLGQDPRYTRFLQAYVGDDRNGAHVSVLSMLARLDIDPWQEASEIASMSEESARQRLASLLALFKDVETGENDRKSLVTKLIAKLPRPNRTPASVSGIPTHRTALLKIPILFWLLGIVILIALIRTLTNGN